LVQLPDNSWWLVCLGFRPKGGNYHHLGRETFLAPITWNADGWPKVGSDGIVKEEMPAPNLPEYVWPAEPARDDFDSIGLRSAWNFVRNPHVADWSLSIKPGFLRLKGSKINFKQKDSPAFIGRRQTAFNVLASAKVSFIPTAINEEAGLVVRGDDANHYDFLVTSTGGKREVMLRKYLQDNIVSLNYKEISDSGDITLRISSTYFQYKFWVQEEGKKAELIGTATTMDLSTEKIGGFTGTYIGMYASGNGSVNVNPADFDWFDFENDPALPFEWANGALESQNDMETPTIDTAYSSAFDQVKIVWRNISNETSYVIERLVGDNYESVGETLVDDTVFNDTGLTEKTMYIYRVLGKNDAGNSYPSVANSVLTLPKPGPYLGSPYQIPGKIEAENYDYGKSGLAFYDTDAGNNAGKYRTDDVEIETCYDTDNGYDVGWINSGEWLTYTVDVNDTIADIQLRVASNSGGRIKLELDGTLIAQTNIAVTGGWSTWKTLTLQNVKLESGKNKVLKITFQSGGFNLNWINFVKLFQTTVRDLQKDVISVYPNPAKHKLCIKSKTFNYSNIEIINSEGKCILSESVRYQPENNLELSMPAGQYILLLTNPTQKRTIQFSIIK
jgi:hypothetical protein